MSDVSQGPGWWLASDGTWYPPHTAPQTTLPPNASAEAPYAAAEVPATHDPYASPIAPQPGADPYAGAATQQAGAHPYGGPPQPTADPYAGQPPGYVAAGYQGQVYAGTAYHPGRPPAAGAEASPSPVPAGPATGTITAPGRAGARWQPWAALAGIALILWGAGQGLLAWSEWHLVQQQFAPYGTVSQGHIAMALTAAGIVIAGIAVVAMALVMDRR